MKEGRQGMDGICSIDFRDHFPAMIGSESHRCVARHRLKHLHITHDVERPERRDSVVNSRNVGTCCRIATSARRYLAQVAYSNLSHRVVHLTRERFRFYFFFVND